MISSESVTARRVPGLAGIDTYDQALATLLAILEHDLKLPALRVSLHLYPGRRALESALVDIGYEPAFARQTARTMVAIGGFRRVLLDEGRLAQVAWADRLSLIAHELAHTLQYELGGGRRGASDQWLREGFAEWVSLRVLEWLEVSSLEAGRRRARQALAGRNRPALRPLGTMVTFPEWVALADAPGARLYEQAFLAADFLIRRRGLPSVIRYFSLLAHSDNRLGNFQIAFGETLFLFEERFTSDMRSDVTRP